jgi:hypothetical protein
MVTTLIYQTGNSSFSVATEHYNPMPPHTCDNTVSKPVQDCKKQRKMAVTFLHPQHAPKDLCVFALFLNLNRQLLFQRLYFRHMPLLLLKFALINYFLQPCRPALTNGLQCHPLEAATKYTE